MTTTRTWKDEMKPEYQRALDEFVAREVVYCVSSLMDTMMRNEDYSIGVLDAYASRINKETQERREVLEHWIVSTWLAERLQEQGEAVLMEHEFLPTPIWGRTTTGQSISSDRVIMDIYDELYADD